MELSLRLNAAAELVKGERVADVGTDHAWLPIYLVRSRHVVARASDINAAPCERAREHIRAVGLADKIEVVHAAGLDGIESFAPDSIVICGMGGEMIASILAASDYPRVSRCQLVLQPQSKQDVLRMWLCSHGFAILSENIVFDEGKYYQLLCAVYDGNGSTLSPIEYRLGSGILDRTLSDTECDWLNLVRNVVTKRVESRKSGTAMSAELAEVQQTDILILRQINHILDRTGTEYANH